AKYVLYELAKLQHDPEAINTIIDPLITVIDEQEINSRINALDTKLGRLNDLYLNTLTTLEDLKEKTAEILKEKAILEKKLTENPQNRLEEEKERIKRKQA
ncbi:hypothetical protein PZH43_13535, partial [Streptococcus gordonii]|nr:hypothetical protein [Streptococcus gordonii]